VRGGRAEVAGEGRGEDLLGVGRGPHLGAEGDAGELAGAEASLAVDELGVELRVVGDEGDDAGGLLADLLDGVGELLEPAEPLARLVGERAHAGGVELLDVGSAAAHW
jgi:hypothetical protein